MEFKDTLAKFLAPGPLTTREELNGVLEELFLGLDAAAAREDVSWLLDDVAKAVPGLLEVVLTSFGAIELSLA